jgi:hypothetical protein
MSKRDTRRGDDGNPFWGRGRWEGSTSCGVAVTGGVQQLPALGWRKITTLVGQVSRFCSVGLNGHWTYIAANREMGKEFGPEKERKLGRKQVWSRKEGKMPFQLILQNLDWFKWIWMISNQSFKPSQIWELELGFKYSNQWILKSKPILICIQTEDFRIEDISIRLGIWIQMKVWIFLKNKILVRKILMSFQKSKIDLGSEMKFKSRDSDFNRFPILERFKPFLNRKFGIWSKDSNSNKWLQTKDIFELQDKDLNFKRRYSPKDLNSINFIKYKGRFRMEIGSNFGWT